MSAHREDHTERFVAYLDDEMSPEERQQFEQELAADEELAAELAEYERTLGLLKGLVSPTPPLNLADGVEGRIRRRSHGRFFALEPKMRLPYEAIAIVLLLGAMLTLFMSAGPSGETPERLTTPGAERQVTPGEAAGFIDALEALGELEMVGDRLHITVWQDKAPALEALLAKHPEIVVERRIPLAGPPKLTFILRRSP